MAEELERAHLVLADISGYTQFMLHNRETKIHGQLIINELMKPLLEETHGLLEVSKLEGDAIFMYDLQATSHHCPQMIYESLKILPRIFERKKSFLVTANICSCQACVNISSLSLKVIVHSGGVLINELKGFVELSGVDVIIVHRLLKNDYKSKKYLLLTKQSCDELELGEQQQLEDHLYQDEDLGDIEIKVLNFEEEQLEGDLSVSLLEKIKHETWKCGTTLLNFLGLKNTLKSD